MVMTIKIELYNIILKADIEKSLKNCIYSHMVKIFIC